MQSTLLTGKVWLGSLALTAVTLAPLLAGPAAVHAAGSVRVVGCSTGSLSAAVAGSNPNLVAPIADSGNDQVEEDQQPKIIGSIPKPRGVSEDDSKKLASLNLATVSRDQAIAAALDVTAVPAQRTVAQAALEGENGYLVWSVKTVLNDSTSGPDPKLEAKVDAGGTGAVLSIECDPNDN